MKLIEFPVQTSGTDLTKISESLKRFLHYCCGISQELGNYYDSHIMLFAHEFSNINLSLKDVDQYLFPSTTKKVIIVRHFDRQMLLNDENRVSPSEQIFDFSPLKGGLEALKDWLEEEKASEVRTQGLSVLKLADLLKIVLGKQFNLTDLDFICHVAACKGLSFNIQKAFALAIQKCLLNETESVHDNINFYQIQYAIDLLTNDYEKDAHAVQAKLDKPFEEEYDNDYAINISNNLRVQRYLEVIDDLKKAIRSFVTIDSSFPVDKIKKILVIDDKITTIATLINKINEIFMKKTIIDYKEPQNLQIDYKLLKKYLTLHSSSNTESLRLNDKADTKQEDPDLSKYDFILVDQLLDESCGRKKWYEGPELIRGIVRFLVDCSYENEELIPKVIALSRTNDPKLIQEALRAGAKDYIVKARLLELPAVLNRVRHQTDEPVNKFHRNFRSLYLLPNETIGILNHLKIPQLPLHSPAITATDGLGTEEEWANVLRVLPKTDLHVHVGSCMSPEFLILASLVGLVRIDFDKVTGILNEITSLINYDQERIGTSDKKLIKQIDISDNFILPYIGEIGDGSLQDWIRECGKCIKSHTKMQIKKIFDTDPISFKDYRKLRSVLYEGLSISDNLDKSEVISKIEKMSYLKLSLFAIRYSENVNRIWDSNVMEEFDIIRILLLALAAKSEDQSVLSFKVGQDQASEINLLMPFRNNDFNSESLKEAWEVLQKLFWGTGDCALDKFREAGWGTTKIQLPNIILNHRKNEDRKDYETITVGSDTGIQGVVATGLHSNNLQEYLEGCEFSGAEHLRHPYLMHLYAQQAIVDFIKKGAFYVELRGSPDGYINPKIGFEFPYACRCLVESFSEAQSKALKIFREPNAYSKEEDPDKKNNSTKWVAAALGEKYKLETLKGLFEQKPEEELARYLPTKVSIIYVGKRHKSMHQMIQEAAASVVMKPAAERNIRTAREFVEKELARCRVVGFDLAGAEAGYPPTGFTEEFQRLSKLHIPLTVHAGENSPSNFIEDSIIELGAQRIGHGLSLSDDKALMARVREEDVCIELCPVSNHQTSNFADPTQGSPGRKYPLREFLKTGIPVTICTDNPIISDTNLVKEYFQASYAYGGEGLSLWEALRIIRMGYSHSFLSLPERRAMLELVGQFLFDLFSDENMINSLKYLADEQDKKSHS